MSPRSSRPCRHIGGTDAPLFIDAGERIPTFSRYNPKREREDPTATQRKRAQRGRDREVRSRHVTPSSTASRQVTRRSVTSSGDSVRPAREGDIVAGDAARPSSASGEASNQINGLSGGSSSHVASRHVTPIGEDRISSPSEFHSEGADAPLRPNPVKQAFDLGVRILTGAGTPELQARKLIGQWRKNDGDAVTLEVLQACCDLSPTEPIPWINRALQARRRDPNHGRDQRLIPGSRLSELPG